MMGCDAVDKSVFRIIDEFFMTKLSPSVFEKEFDVLEVLDHHVFVSLGRKISVLNG